MNYARTMNFFNPICHPPLHDIVIQQHRFDHLNIIFWKLFYKLTEDSIFYIILFRQLSYIKASFSNTKILFELSNLEVSRSQKPNHRKFLGKYKTRIRYFRGEKSLKSRWKNHTYQKTFIWCLWTGLYNLFMEQPSSWPAEFDLFCVSILRALKFTLVGHFRRDKKQTFVYNLWRVVFASKIFKTQTSPLFSVKICIREFLA